MLKVGDSVTYHGLLSVLEGKQGQVVMVDTKGRFLVDFGYNYSKIYVKANNVVPA